MSQATRVALFTEVNSKFGLPFFEDLVMHRDIDLVAVVTSPEGQLCDYYVGEPDPVDVAERANWLGVPVLRPRRVNDRAVIQALRAAAPDYLIIANYQQIFRDELLEVPVRATVNFHPSPLPRYAGLAPFFWMALAGERDSGVTALLTVRGVDAGPVLAQRPVPLSGTETSGQVRDALFGESRQLLHEMIPRLVAGDLRARPQDEAKRTYFSRPRRQDTSIDWSWPMEQVLRTIRACNPKPGAAVSADGAIRILAARPLPALTGSRAAPGAITADPDYGLVISCSDGWLQVIALTWDPARAGAAGSSCVPDDRPGSVSETSVDHGSAITEQTRWKTHCDEQVAH